MRSINSKLYSIIDSSRQAIRCHLEISARITLCHPNITQIHEKSLFCRKKLQSNTLQHNLTKSILGSSENILLRARLRFFLRRCASSPNQRQKMHRNLLKRARPTNKGRSATVSITNGSKHCANTHDVPR